MDLFFSALLVSLSAAVAPVYQAELIRPPEQAHNHSASLVETPAGDLIAAWFHGVGEKSDDTLVIQGARKRKGESEWSEPFVMANNDGLPDQNPVIYIDPQGKLYLWWISALANTRESYFLQYRSSTDYEGDGPPKWNWNGFITEEPKNLVATIDTMAAGVDAKYGNAFDSEPKYRERLVHATRMVRFDETYIDDWKEPVLGRLPSMLSWMPRCQPIMLADKRMAIGLYSDVFMTSLTCFTSDGGETWSYGEPMADYGLIQPALVQRKDGTLVAYGRDKGPARKIRVAESADQGATWTKFYDLPVDNPDSSISVIALKSGSWVLICNDLPGTNDRHGRSRLVSMLSDDEGVSWKWRRALEDSTKAPDFHPHVSYPTAIQTSDGLIHVVYTYTPGDETIKHVVFDETWIQGADNTTAR